MRAARGSEQRVARMVERHGAVLMRVARQLSLCQDDAQDAYQRSLEIYLRRVESLDPVTELAWLKVVVRHEALAVRRTRAEMVAAEEPDLDAHPAGDQRSVDDRIASGERSARSAEALRHLKPDEARALMLKAQGHSYQEIGRDLGWSYTKVNRSITEGRARFMKVFGRIEAGEECERFEPVLTAMVFGEAGPEQLLEIRPHLRHCARCRADIRRLHLSRRDRAAALIPLPILVPLRWIGDKLGIGPDLHGAVHRFHASDVATGVQLAGTSGGGRGGAIAALIGMCVSSLGAGAACVATGVLPDPVGIVRQDDRPTQSKAPKRPVETRLANLPDPAVGASAPASHQTERSKRRKPRHARAGGAQRRQTPTSHEKPAVSPPAPGSTGEFSIEQNAPATRPQPAAATGGSEFGP